MTISPRKLYSSQRAGHGENPGVGLNEPASAPAAVNAQDALARENALLRNQLEEKMTFIAELGAATADLEARWLTADESLRTATARIAKYAAEVDAQKSLAYEQGLAEAGETLQREAATLAQTHQDQLTAALHGIFDSYRQVVCQAEATIVEIALSAALKLFGEMHLANNGQYRKYLVDMVQESSQTLSRFDNLRVHLAPADYEILVGGKRPVERDGNIAGVPTACFVPDDSLSPGGCRVNSVHGELDLRLERRIEALKNALLHAARAGRIPAQ